MGKRYPTMEGVVLNKREKEILDGDELKSHEGMVFGRMYADWKRGEDLSGDLHSKTIQESTYI